MTTYLDKINAVAPGKLKETDRLLIGFNNKTWLTLQVPVTQAMPAPGVTFFNTGVLRMLLMEAQ